MADLRCTISLRQYQSKYLSVWPSDHTDAWLLCAKPVNDSRGTNWILRDIPGTSAKLLIKDGGAANGEVVTWTGGIQNIVLTRPRQEGWDEQVVVLDDVGGGYVAINNHDRDRVLDRSQSPEQDPFVISFKWNGHDNQQWLIHDR